VTCDELQTLLPGYVDEELDLVHQLDAERHLEACPACARACKQLQGLQATLKDASFRFAPPPGLRGRIISGLRKVDPIPQPRRSRLWLAVASCAAMFALVAWGVSFWMASAEDDRLAQEALASRVHSLESELMEARADQVAKEVVASHVRSLMVNHLTDVTSTDQHTVRPWFQEDGKINFSPAVFNFSKEDFPLVGGRLDYVDNRVVAALVYKRRKHKINVLIWPSSTTAEQEPRSLTRQTYHLVQFTRGGLTTWAVSDLNAEELLAFVELLRKHDHP
jgi:anti-sigma factor RsiW